MTHQQNALIIGGGSGMGRATAEELLRQGFRIHVADLSLESCQQWIKTLGSDAERVRAYPVDISSSASVAALFSD